MEGLKVGHFTHTDDGTGVSVFLFDQAAPAAYVLCGSSPATRELNTLELDANTSKIDGLAFAGGSALGLGAVDGVMRWFRQQKRGKKTPFGPVPIVPAACIYDLGIQSDRPPGAEEAYQACQTATYHNLAQGRIGAGTGASIGKLIPGTSRMSGGWGCSEITLATGLQVLAYAVVNAVGDIRDSQGTILAGARLPDGHFANCEQYLLSGKSERQDYSDNTTLVAVFTNAVFSKAELRRIAKVGLTGMARAINPVFTRYDGDIIFCVSLGNQTVSETTVSVCAAEAVRSAILNAVKESILL